MTIILLFLIDVWFHGFAVSDKSSFSNRIQQFRRLTGTDLDAAKYNKLNLSLKNYKEIQYNQQYLLK